MRCIAEWLHRTWWWRRLPFTRRLQQTLLRRRSFIIRAPCSNDMCSSSGPGHILYPHVMTSHIYNKHLHDHYKFFLSFCYICCTLIFYLISHFILLLYFCTSCMLWCPCAHSKFCHMIYDIQCMKYDSAFETTRLLQISTSKLLRAAAKL